MELSKDPTVEKRSLQLAVMIVLVVGTIVIFGFSTASYIMWTDAKATPNPTHPWDVFTTVLLILFLIDIGLFLLSGLFILSGKWLVYLVGVPQLIISIGLLITLSIGALYANKSPQPANVNYWSNIANSVYYPCKFCRISSFIPECAQLLIMCNSNPRTAQITTTSELDTPYYFWWLFATNISRIVWTVIVFVLHTFYLQYDSIKAAVTAQITKIQTYRQKRK